MAATLGVEPGPHWWEASALTTAPPSLPKGAQIVHGNFNLLTATLMAFFASLTPCQLRRPTVATKSQNAKSKVDI